jgi:translation elongation factor EF-G
VLPNPIETQQFRLPYLLNLNTNDSDIDEEVRMALAKCSNHEEAPLIIFISKMVNIPKGNINERGLN